MYHPVVSVLETSFDSLKYEHQLILVDVGIFSPCVIWRLECHNILDWLCMMHEESAEDMKHLEITFGGLGWWRLIRNSSQQFVLESEEIEGGGDSEVQVQGRVGFEQLDGVGDAYGGWLPEFERLTELNVLATMFDRVGGGRLFETGGNARSEYVSAVGKLFETGGNAGSEYVSAVGKTFTRELPSLKEVDLQQTCNVDEDDHVD